MKRYLMFFVCLMLCACDDVKKEEQVLKTAQIERQNVMENIENKITPEQKKRIFENKMFDLCQERFAQEHVMHYPIRYKNNVCICFAEKVTTSVFLSAQEIEKYNSSELYQKKIQEQVFGECADKNKKYMSGW